MDRSACTRRHARAHAHRPTARRSGRRVFLPAASGTHPLQPVLELRHFRREFVHIPLARRLRRLRGRNGRSLARCAAAHAALRKASDAENSKRCDGREYLDATKIARGFLCKRLRRLDFTTIRIESPQDVHTARSRPEMHASERAQTPKSKDARAEIARLSQRKRLRRADATQR